MYCKSIFYKKVVTNVHMAIIWGARKTRGPKTKTKTKKLLSKGENQQQTQSKYETLLGGSLRGRGLTYVPGLNFKYGCFVFCEVGHVLVSI